MAKAGTWMQGAKGKVGNQVFYKGKGGTKQRVFVIPKNPQTAAQMAQRIIFATVTQAAAVMNPIISQSFEGESGDVSRQKFIKENIRRLRAGAQRDFIETPKAAESSVFMTTKGVSQLIPNSYVISKGSIRNFCPIGLVSDDKNIYATIVKEIRIPYTKTGDSYQFEVADIFRAITGIAHDKEQVTFNGIFVNDSNILYSYEGDAEAAGFSITDTTFAAMRIVPKAASGLVPTINVPSTPLDITNSITVSALMRYCCDQNKTAEEALELVVNAVKSGTARDVPDGSYVSIVGQTTLATSTAPKWSYNGDKNVAGAVICSRLVGKSWKRSTETMQLCQPSETGEGNFGLFWNSALPAWFEEQTLVESDKFIEQGGNDTTLE